MTGNFSGINKINVKTLMLTSLVSKKSIDIKSVANQLEIFKSIFDPTTIGSVTVSDGSGLLQNLPMLGEEILYMEIETPNKETYSKAMWVYHVDNLEFNPNGSHINFVLRFASSDQYNASTTIVSQGFKQSISDIVTSILKNKVKTTQKIDIEPTKGIETIIIPHWNCLKSIEFLRQRAVSTKYNSPFVFFEDVNGYHFGSYEYIINQRKSNIDKLTFTSDPWLPEAGDVAGKVTVLQKQFRNAFDLSIGQKTNTAKLLNDGGLSSRNLVFDILNKSVKTIDTTYKDAPTLVKQAFGSQFHPGHSDNFVTSIGATPPVQFMIPIDSTNPSNVIEAYNKKKLYASMLNENKISFNTPGDITIQPGDIIQFNMPSQVNSGNDKQLSGQFIIGNLRHGIFSEQMVTTIDAYRAGFSDKVI